MKHELSLRIVKILDAVLMAVPFAVCWCVYYASRTASPFYYRGNLAVIILFLILYVIYGKIYDGFLVSLNRISEMIYSQALALIFTDFILYIVTFLLMKHLPNPLPLLLTFAAQLLLAAAWALCAHKWYYAKFPATDTAVIFDTRSGMDRLIGEYGLDKKFHIRLTISADECLENIHVIDEMKTVFLSGVHSHDRNVILKYCVEHWIDVYVIPRIGDVIMSGAKKMHMFHLPMLRVGRYNPNPFYLFAKRLLDIVISGIAVVVLSPVLIITAIAIKVSDGGPVLYRQTRLTKDGEEFEVLKFRSMRVDAEKDGVARLSTGDNDDRITPVGRVIRKSRIDELPQLFCILSGKMSIVGPRPERPEIAKIYEEKIPEFRLRLQAKAGLTGYAQVYGKYNTTPYDKLQMDLMYIANPSFAEDFKIMFATIKILFMSESTEGIAEGCVTAGEDVEEVSSTKTGYRNHSALSGEINSDMSGNKDENVPVVDLSDYKVKGTAAEISARIEILGSAAK